MKMELIKQNSRNIALKRLYYLNIDKDHTGFTVETTEKQNSFKEKNE